jgi:hypothetical protein
MTDGESEGTAASPDSRAAARTAALCLAIAALTATAAGIGVFGRDAPDFATVESVRGEVYEMSTAGVYAYNARRLVAEGVGWDIFTLFFAVPALLLALPGIRRGSLAAKLFGTGILAYLFYQYLMYAVTWAFGPLFLLFVTVYALSLVGIVWLVSTIPVVELPTRFSDGFPRRGMAILSFLLAALLVVMWLGRIVPALGGDTDGVLLGQTTLVVQALDLGLIVPLALFTGVMAWRGTAIGYLLASTVVVKAFAMAAAICAMLLLAWVYEGRLEVPPLIIFGAAAVATAWLGIRMYRGIRPAV